MGLSPAGRTISGAEPFSDHGARQVKNRVLSRCSLSCCVASATLAGCGGSQPPIAALGTMPQTSALAAHAGRGKTWMLPEAKIKDLLYVADDAVGVYVFTYPQGQLVGQIGVDSPFGICSDKAGNVFIPDSMDSKVVEYAHGGTSPIATLYPNAQPFYCSVDPASGNLATLNRDTSDRGSVSIFKGASGSPQKYFDATANLGATCSYDNQGNLYVGASTEGRQFLIAELPSGRATFKNVTVNGDFRGGNFLQWDGEYVAVTNAFPKKPVTVSQVAVAGSIGSVVGATVLRESFAYIKFFWIQGHSIITPGNGGGPQARKIGFWSYPRGGRPLQTVMLAKGKNLPGIALGITVSVARR